MKLDLGSLLKAVGLPVALVGVFAAILFALGLDLSEVEVIAGGLLGFQAGIALLIDVLKRTGAVDDDTAGKWSAGLNIVLIIGVAAVLKLNPAFDFGGLDAQAQVFVSFAALLVSLLLQVLGTQSFHKAYVKGLGLKQFSHSLSPM